jgi:hypothetical protein
VGGEYISFSFNAPAKINPFDLAQIREEGENQLGQKILSLHSLLKVIMGAITPTQEALLDRAFVMTYRNKGITMDPDTQGREPPLMEDLYKTLIGMEVPEALDLAARIEKFVRGSFVGIFDKQTNININNPFTVFSVKDMQDALRPIAMFIILDFIWTRVKKDLKKRILIAEDDAHIREGLLATLESEGYAATAARDGAGVAELETAIETTLAGSVSNAAMIERRGLRPVKYAMMARPRLPMPTSATPWPSGVSRKSPMLSDRARTS